MGYNSNNMEEKIYNEIVNNNLFVSCNRVAVACSGGSDSIALLNCLNNLKDKLNIQLFAIHVNHNIRGAEAKRDEKFVKDFCSKNGINFILKNVDALEYSRQNKMTLEQGARVLRYGAFEDAKNENNLDCICLAHNKMDQAETILMHIGRGSGLNGLIGMVRKSGFYIRPMLEISKQEILDYLVKNHVQNIEDSTNFSDEYKRNFVRHKLLPSFEQAFPNAVERITNLSVLASTDLDFVESCVPLNLIEKDKDGVLLRAEILNYHLAIQNRAVRRCFSCIATLVDVEEKHITIAIELLKNEIGKSVDMPNNVKVIRVYNGIVFTLKKESSTEEIPFELGRVLLGNYTIFAELVNADEIKFNQDRILFVDAGKIAPNAVWRTIKTGDSIAKFGGGRKSVKEYLVSKKVSSLTRKNLPVLACGNDCLLILGVDISSELKIDENTKRIVKVWFE